MKQRYYVSAITIAAVAAALAGCGGGGGGSSSPPTSTGPFANMKTNAFVFAPISTSSSAPVPVNPASGPESGGTVVTVNGSGAVVAPVTVYFGNTPGTNSRIVNTSTTTTSINVISPSVASGTGTVDVRVVDANGVSAVSTSDKFTFVPPPPPPPPVSAISAAKP